MDLPDVLVGVDDAHVVIYTHRVYRLPQLSGGVLAAEMCTFHVIDAHGELTWSREPVAIVDDVTAVVWTGAGQLDDAPAWRALFERVTAGSASCPRALERLRTARPLRAPTVVEREADTAEWLDDFRAAEQGVRRVPDELARVEVYEAPLPHARLVAAYGDGRAPILWGVFKRFE
jgi:hypothetical protein